MSFGLHDSPAGQLAWIVEKFREWTDPAKELSHEAVDRDRLPTNVTLYWLTGTAGTSANLYYETAHSGLWGAAEKSGVPTGVAVFPDDQSIRSTAEVEHNIVHWSEFDGAATSMEAPDLLVGDIRDFFRELRCAAAPQAPHLVGVCGAGPETGFDSPATGGFTVPSHEDRCSRHDVRDGRSPATTV